MVIDFRRNTEPVQPVVIKGESVEIVSTYKYLGVVIDDKLDWSNQADSVYKKGQTRLFFLRKLRSFKVCSRMLCMFYHSMVSCVLTFALVCRGGNASEHDTGRLNKLIKKALSSVGQPLDQLERILENRLSRKSKTILQCLEHPLHSTLVGRHSVFRNRHLLPKIKTNRFRSSFLPAAIRDPSS